MPAQDKRIELDELVSSRAVYRAEGKTVVWTNGCFDLFHAGHARSLAAAAAQGDVLVVGVNGDASVRELKGPRRPYCGADDRVAVLSALACVDHVVIFDGKRCTPELEALRPDVYCKGDDYTLETIDQDERRAVEEGGGRVAFLPLVEGLSTTNLLKAVRRSDPEKIISAAFALIRDEAGRLLMVGSEYREGVRWGLPGGGHHRGESLAETIVRECREETGLDVSVTRYVGVIERIEPALDLHLVLHLHEAVVTGGTLHVDPNEENVVDAAWLSAEDIRAHEGWILGRQHLLAYLADPAAFPPYIFMGPGEE